MRSRASAFCLSSSGIDATNSESPSKAGVERILGLGQLEMGPAATEQADEQLGKVLVDLLERGQQALSALPVQARNALAQPADGGNQVAPLRLHAGDLGV